MLGKFLRCVDCRSERSYALDYACPHCGGILEVVHTGGFSAELMPRLPPDRTLGEGNTPLLSTKADLLVEGFAGEIWLKDETRNPSGSFKDRHVASAIASALELGIGGVVCASSGNAGAATAAYAARVGLPAIIVAPERTPPEKLIQIAAYGAHLVRVKGHYSNSYQLGLRIAQDAQFANLTTTFLNPLGTDGLRLAGQEIFTQLGGQVPDWVMVPTGAGPLVKGVFQGFEDMGQGMPRLVAVQAEGCAPIVRAFDEGVTEVRAWSDPTTFASGISDPLIGYERDGTYTLRLVHSSGGVAVAVSDDEIRRAMHDLATKAGVLAEPTGASSFAALTKLAAQGIIGRNDRVVCMITGHGFKDFGTYRQTVPEGLLCAADADVTELLRNFQI